MTAVEERIRREIVDRAISDDFDAWERQVERTGGCSHPIRLYGQVVEDGQVVLDTANEPNGVLLKPCGNRRAAVCPSCSHTYRGDQWQMLHAGLVGGKGVPESVASHPAAFVTLTAPSFGAVHGQRDNGTCRPRKPRRCRHGRPMWCRQRHEDGDDQLGQPLCADCYDYVGHVLWTWYSSSELWRRFTIYLRRVLAAEFGVSQAAFQKLVRVSFAKVAEFQTRGIIHFHAIIRLDGFTATGEFIPPPAGLTFDMLDAAVRTAAARVSYLAESDNDPVRLGFGSQIDVRRIAFGGEVTGEAIAAYISKYATKGAEDLGVGVLDCESPSPHIRRLLATGRRLAEDVPELERMARWQHMLFFPGHFSTKSRRYSVTLGSLRKARTTYQRRRAREARGLDPDDEETTMVVTRLGYVGRGYHTTGDAVLAASIAARTREGRELARQNRSR